MAIALTGRTLGNLPSNTKINSEEHAKAIRTRSGKQLSGIHVKRSSINQETKSPAIEEPIEHDEQIEESTPAEKLGKTQGKTTVNPHEPPIPFPQRLKKQKLEQQYKKFLEMPSYAKSLKDILSNKHKLWDHETVMLIEECSTRIQKKLLPKLKDPGSFIVPCTIGEIYFDKVLCDLGASINLMSLSVFRKLGLRKAKVTTVTLQLADRSLTHPRGIIEDMLIKVEKFIFPTNFLMLDMEEDKDIQLILGRLFLSTGRALIDFHNGQLILRLGEEQISFNVFKAMKLPTETDSYAYEACIAHSQSMQPDSVEMKTCARFLDTNPPYTRRRHFEELGTGPMKPLPSIHSRQN
ncbi:uncharacterized protein LOC111408526 [Olea europaea var. sylvestris]|uniref:uncharacterized protein LOC111408526 n=1 Tax=Olea europaea var. sylvestris TaxID=158386 RepID=UPI000C1CFD7B|nr:uncharacterized protein LOC111408526 [Olea europaea var. sylvestris]